MLDSKKEVAELIKAGHLREYLTAKGREIAAEGDKNRQTMNPSPVANAEERIINIYNKRNGPDESNCTIVFTEEEVRGVNAPHHDALVIKISITNLTVKRVLVENGSSANVMFLKTFKNM